MFYSKIFLVDLTCRTPPYTYHIFKELKKKCSTILLWVSGCPETYSYLSTKNSKKALINLYGTFRITHNRSNNYFRRGIKLLEYIINSIIIQKLVRNIKPKVIHYQNFPLIEIFYYVEKFNIIALKKTKSKLVLTVHNVLPHNTNKRLFGKYKWLYSNVDKLICHTKESRNILIDEFKIKEEKVHVVKHGPVKSGSKKYKKQEARIRLGYQNTENLILFFGGISPYKGVEFLIESFKAVINEMENTKLIIAGSGDYKYLNSINKYIYKYHLDKYIDQYFYFLSNEELALLICAADIVVLPYKEITHSGVLFTAMEAGKAIIATNKGGLKETIDNGKNGVLVDYGNNKMLSNSFISLLNDEEFRINIGREAERMVKEKYSWEKSASKTLKIYKSLIE